MKLLRDRHKLEKELESVLEKIDYDLGRKRKKEVIGMMNSYSWINARYDNGLPNAEWEEP